VQVQHKPLVDYYRSKGMRVFVTIDATNGLDRSAESPGLVSAGRSLSEPDVRQIYRDYAVAVDTILRPDYLGLAAETNLMMIFQRQLHIFGSFGASMRNIADGLAKMAGGLTPALVAWIALYLPWRLVFVMFGFVGVAWAALWYWWFRDEPREHPAVNAAEVKLIETTRGLPPGDVTRGTWSEVFRIPSLLPLCLQYVANSYGYYFFITWLPTYLVKARGMSSAELAIFSGLPLTLSAIADVSGGFTTDALCRRLGLRAGMRSIGVVSYLLAAAAMIGGTLASNPRVGGTLIALGGAFSMFTLAPSWSTAIGLGGRNTALLSSVMNTSGQVGAFFSPIVLALLVDHFGDWSLPLHVLSGLYLMAAICWLLIRPERK